MAYNSSHLRTNSINFSFISEDKNRQHPLQANTRSTVEKTSEGSYYRNRAGTDRSGPVPSRQTFYLSNGDGTELRRERRRSCQYEHLRLITHEKMLLNGDVP